MGESSDRSPHIALDPSSTNASETHDSEKKDHKPRDSKGWDGKLRVDKSVLVDGQHEPGAESDPEVSEDEGPPPEQLAADEDLLDDCPEDEEDIELVHMKVANIPALRLERFKQLKVPALVLRASSHG